MRSRLSQSLRPSGSRRFIRHANFPFFRNGLILIFVKDSSVKDALKIRQAAYFCRESMTIVSEETLGIRRVDDKRFSIHDQTPVPSLLDFQIDTIAIHYMSRIMKHVIKRLKRAIFGKRNKEHWYEVYLTCFVLLSTLTTVYSLQLSYMGWNQNMVGY